MTDEKNTYQPGDVLLDIAAAGCEIGGEGKPVHPSTVYRGIARGIYTPPIRTAPNTARFIQRVLRNDIKKYADSSPSDFACGRPARNRGAK